MTTDKVIFLAFKNENIELGNRDLYACTACRNKAYSLVYQGDGQFPLLECTACHKHIGRVGWADEEES